MNELYKEIEVKVSLAEALVLTDLIKRLDDFSSFKNEEFSEYEKRALWNLECCLEKVLVEPFIDDYKKLLNKAKDQLTPPFDLYLPEQVIKSSISEKELVLSKEKAIEVIQLLKTKRIKVHGWEGWLRDKDGKVGHGNAPQGTASLDDLSFEDAADFCIDTINKDYEKWCRENSNNSAELFFCLSI